MNDPKYLKGLLIRLIQNNDKSVMNGQGNIYAKYTPIILAARALGKEIEGYKEINNLWHKYIKARISRDNKQITEYAIQLENSITLNYRYIVEFTKETENIDINDDSKKDCWRAEFIGILASDEY